MASFRLSRMYVLRTIGLLSALLGSGAAASAQDLNVERGLYVWQSRDSLHVQWITPTAQPSMVNGITTPVGLSHHVMLPKSFDDNFVLRFGSHDNPKHVTIYQKNRTPRVSLPHTDSLYVFGDTHGEFETVRRVLRNAGLIDDQLRWAGGRKQIVFLGDITDRGAHVIPLLWFLYRLDHEANSAGGAVHVLLGNHEVMVMLGDLRYVHPLEKQIADLHNVSYQQLLHPQRSVLGRWLASKPAVIKIGDLLLTHGGVSSDFIGETTESIAKKLNQNIKDEIFAAQVDTTMRARVDSAHFARWDKFFWHERSLFWYRGYAMSDTLDTELTKTLESFDASAMVVGHTPAPTMQTRYNGKLIIAHPRRPGTELLLITGRGAQRRLSRIVSHGPPEPISP